MVVSKIYAKALFELSVEENKLEEIFSRVIFFVENIFKESEFENFLLNPSINFKEKKNVLGKIFTDDNDNLLSNFFLLLIQKDRFKYIRDIFNDFFDEYYKYKNILRVQIVSASILPQNIIDDIKKVLEKKFNASVVFETLIDKSIIGGFIIKANETLIDASIKFSLENFKNYLLDSDLEEWSGLSV